MSEEASITPLVSHLRQLSSLYQKLSSECKNLVEECKQTGNQLSMLQQLLERLPNSPTASTTVTSFCKWAADKLQVQVVVLWILDKGTERLWTLLPGGEVIYAPFVEKDGNSTSSALRVLFEKDVTTLPANEVGWDLDQCVLLPSGNAGGRLPHRFSMIGMGRNEMGEGTAVLQAVNSLRNEENMFIREDEIHMQDVLSTVAAIAGLVKAMFEQESAIAEAFCGSSTSNTQYGRDGNIGGDISISEEMKSHDDEFVPRDWLIEKLLQNAARAVGAVSCKLVLHDRMRNNNDVGSISPSLHPISQALEERMLVLSRPVLTPGTGVFLGKLLTTFVAENESKAVEAFPSQAQETYLAEISVIVGNVLASAFNRFSHADRVAGAILACQCGDHMGMCKTVARGIKMVVACKVVKAVYFGLENQDQEEEEPLQQELPPSPPKSSSDEGDKSKWIGFSVSGSLDTGIPISGTSSSLDMGDFIQEGNSSIGVKDMELLLHSARHSPDIVKSEYESLTPEKNNSANARMMTRGIFLERCVVVPLAFGCGIVAIVERDEEDDPFSPLEMSAILHLGYELGLLVSMRMKKVDIKEEEEEEGQQQQQQERMVVSRRKGTEKDADEWFQISRIEEMKEKAATEAWTSVRQFAEVMPLPMAMHSEDGANVRQFLYSIRSSILPEALVSVICNILPGCICVALYDHVSSMDIEQKGVRSDYEIQQRETSDVTAETFIRCCRVIGLHCVSNNKSEWISAETLQQTLDDFQNDMILDEWPPTRYFERLNSPKTGSSIECNPPPPSLETTSAAPTVSDVSRFYAPLPGRDAALELTCTETSKAAECIALGIAPIFSNFLAWRDKVTENLILSITRAFIVAVKRIAFRHLAICAQREVKLKFELQIEDMMKAQQQQVEHSEEEQDSSCMKQHDSQLEDEEDEGRGRCSITIESRNEKKNIDDITEGNMLVNMKEAHIGNDGDAVTQQQCKSTATEDEQQHNDAIAALEYELLQAKLLYSNIHEKLDVEIGELQNVNKIKEALELQVETLKSEHQNSTREWGLEVEELQSKLLTVNEWYQNSLNENQELQKHVELLSISLRDANTENAFLHKHFEDVESKLHDVQKEKEDELKSLTENAQVLQQDLTDCTLKLQDANTENEFLHKHFEDVESRLHAIQKEKDNELKSLTENTQVLQQDLTDCTLKLQDVDGKNERLHFELSSADEANRDLVKQLDELKVQVKKEKKEENELICKLMAIEKENNDFVRNVKDCELKLSRALQERDAVQAEKDSGEFMSKQELESVKLYARREIDTLQLKLEEECTKLKSMSDDHVANEDLLQSEIETIKGNLDIEKNKNYSELKMALQKHLGNEELALSNDVTTFEDLLSVFQTHLKVTYSLEMQEKDKAYKLQLDSAESRFMEEKSGLQSQLDDIKTKFSALQDNVSILTKEKDATKSELEAIQHELSKEKFEHEAQLQKERERCRQALEMHQSCVVPKSDLVAYNNKPEEELCGVGTRQTYKIQHQQFNHDLSSNRSLHVEVGGETLSVGGGEEYDLLHTSELLSLLKVRDKEMSALVKCLHDAVQDRDNLEAQLQQDRDLMKSRFCDDDSDSILESRLTEENGNRVELSRGDTFSNGTWWHPTAIQLKGKEETTVEQNSTPNDGGDCKTNLSLVAPLPASPRSVSLYHHETSSHYSLVSSSNSSSMHTLLQGLVETLSAPRDFTLPSDLPSFANCVQDAAVGLFGVDAAHLYVVNAARGDLQLCFTNDGVGNEDGSVMKQEQPQNQTSSLSSVVPHSVSFGKGLVGTAAITAQPQISVDVGIGNTDHLTETLCMPVMLLKACSSNTTDMWHESKGLDEEDDDDLESENVEVLGVLHLSRLSLHNEEGDLEEGLGIGFTGDDARVVATFCGQVALALSSLQRRIVLCHRLEEVAREKTRVVVQRNNGEDDDMARELQRLRARLSVAEARLIARKKRGATKKPWRWDQTVERGMFYSKHIAALIEKQREMQSTVLLLNSENATLRHDLEKERAARKQEREAEQQLLPVLVGLRKLHDIDTKCVEKHKRQKKRNARL